MGVEAQGFLQAAAEEQRRLARPQEALEERQKIARSTAEYADKELMGGWEGRLFARIVAKGQSAILASAEAKSAEEATTEEETKALEDLHLPEPVDNWEDHLESGA